MLIIRLFNFVELPANLNLFNKTISVREDLTETQKLDYSQYRCMLNSDLTILLGIALANNQHLQELLLTDLNLYNIDVQLLVQAIKADNLSNLTKLSFKRTIFMDKLHDFHQILAH